MKPHTNTPGLKRSINNSMLFRIGLSARKQQTVQKKDVSPEHHSEGALGVSFGPAVCCRVSTSAHWVTSQAGLG
ncbi:hypothetical protein UPYG_G00108660 [Umbra pygmaea]|uniref:Uncharacterized protein n=1 Tax=Umbra pygmaea TaxID=75934 RepID=A0ABD0XPZ6_UMBPY